MVINLANEGERIIYYKTNAYCAPYQPAIADGQGIPPFTNEVSEPVSLPTIRAEEGSALPFTVLCTEDLRYVPLLPGSSATSEYYIVVSKDFKGSIGGRGGDMLRPRHRLQRTQRYGGDRPISVSRTLGFSVAELLAMLLCRCFYLPRLVYAVTYSL